MTMITCKTNPITNHSKHASLLALVFLLNVVGLFELSFFVFAVFAFVMSGYYLGFILNTDLHVTSINFINISKTVSIL